MILSLGMLLFVLAAVFLSSSFEVAVLFWGKGDLRMFVAVVVVLSIFSFLVICGLPECVGGLGCRRLLFPAWSSVFASSVSGISCLMSVPVDGNDNFVCRLAFVSLSLAGVTFVCLDFAPRRGDE